MEKTVSAVLVAAGSSTRMGFDKLSFDLGGETVLHRSIRAFAQCPQVTEIVLVAGKNREFVAQQAADCPKPVQIVAGGATRAESAKNGVFVVFGELVAVPDAARSLMDVVRLRWRAVALGFEWVKVKNGLMLLRFISDSASPYYKSALFLGILKYVSKNNA